MKAGPSMEQELKVDCHDDVQLGSLEEIGVNKEMQKGLHGLFKDVITNDIMDISNSVGVSIKKKSQKSFM